MRISDTSEIKQHQDLKLPILHLEEDKSGERNKFRKRKPFCFFCKKKGHTLKDCKFRQKGSILLVHEVLYNLQSPSSVGFILDSGASQNITDEKADLSDYTLLKPQEAPSFRVAGLDNVHLSVGKGSMRIYANGKCLAISTVYHVPTLNSKILSEGYFDSLGCKIIKEGGQCRVISKSDCVLFNAIRENNIYTLNIILIRENQINLGFQENKNSTVPLMWHKRLGHIGLRN
ncbi:unnamed protein product [Rotaria magnacalcarata]|uniref:CCHC-type domain-containing protein n=1 Tax=Rotaria magnacalcarata TaxID=392030 RepID=A0A816MVQ1_9BILA|nr:unnamed protein product [Rotaria magnacalcarata]CAF4188441.1 unnamed protein product [Rotaria magnacalcarata]